MEPRLLAANLDYALRASPSLDIHIGVDGDMTTVIVTTSTGEHIGTDADPIVALQRALLEIGL